MIAASLYPIRNVLTAAVLFAWFIATAPAAAAALAQVRDGLAGLGWLA
jgi:hypothetical protein